MIYDITKPTPPEMPTLGKGLETQRLLLSQTSKDMHEPLVPMLFPVLGAHISGAEFQYPDLTWKEPTGMMANLVGDSGCNKGQLSNLVEAICRDFRQHDEAELKKLVEWSKQVKSKASTKEKPTRPDVAFYFPPNDTTRPAFLKLLWHSKRKVVERNTSICQRWRWPTACVEVTNRSVRCYVTSTTASVQVPCVPQQMV